MLCSSGKPSVTSDCGVKGGVSTKFWGFKFMESIFGFIIGPEDILSNASSFVCALYHTHKDISGFLSHISVNAATCSRKNDWLLSYMDKNFNLNFLLDLEEISSEYDVKRNRTMHSSVAILTNIQTIQCCIFVCLECQTWQRWMGKGIIKIFLKQDFLNWKTCFHSSKAGLAYIDLTVVFSSKIFKLHRQNEKSLTEPHNMNGPHSLQIDNEKMV